MNCVDLILLQILAHFLADFTFQSQTMCDKKAQRIFSKELIIHTVIVFICSFVMFMTTGAANIWIVASLIITVSHFGLDILKIYSTKKQLLKKSLFFIDQILHFIVIVIVVRVCYTEPTPWGIDFKTLPIITAFVACTKPSNVFIKNYMEAKGIISKKDEKNALMNAGRIIGSLERVLSFILIIFNQFAAVGFIIAAKSILRFRDTDTAKTEYLLIGSLLSFGIAIILGIICSQYIGIFFVNIE
jgi:hypothetical protein